MIDARSLERHRPRPHRRALVALLLSMALATCTTDHTPTGPGRGGHGYLAIRPLIQAPADLAAFNLTIDSLRVIALRPPSDTAADTTVFFSPDSTSLHLALPISLTSNPETLTLILQLLAGKKVMFSGSQSVSVSAGPPDTSGAPVVPLSYVGPGSGITQLKVTPQDSVVNLGGTQLFRATATASGVPVDSFYVAWTTSDTTKAKINAQGLLKAPGARGAVFVRVVTPNNVHDSTRVTFIPTPAALTIASGNGQSATVGTRVASPLRVRVTASDLGAVKGVPVKFASPSGTVRDSIVATDSAGFAQDSVTVGTVSGSQLFTATVGALKPDTFTVSATPGAVSAAKSVVTVSSATISSGGVATLTLQAKDVFNNNLTTGGATVVFSASGGTSTGTIGSLVDHANGTYTATFTGLVSGTATTIGATVNGTAVTTTLPTIAVTAGTISSLTSVVSTSSGTVSSGASATLTLQAKDSGGNTIATGGATVVFSRSGGTSTGVISATTDHNNGTYTATFTGDTAGTATTIRATVNSVLATSTTPIIVVPGNTTAARSVITVSKDTIGSGAKDTLTLQAKDSAGNNLTTGGLVVVFSHAGGTSGGTITPSTATDNNNGKYTAVFTGDTAGTATTIHATIAGQQVTSTLPTITVIPGAISTVKSVVTSSDSVTTTGGVLTLTLTGKDAAGNALTKGGATVVFTQGGGTSTGTIAPSPATDNNTGTYTATFTGVNGGTATTIGATIGAVAVTSVPLPRIRVIVTVHSADILADETWAAGSHRVTNYIRVRNGATLTIALGDTVKFDPGAGLQIGDTTLGSGGLIMDGTQPGTAPGITLTANGTGVPGFWKGIEVQRTLAGLPAWRRVLIEWAGGTRSAVSGVPAEACILVVNQSSADTVQLDSVRIRRCVHAGIHDFGGIAHVRRSEIDSVTGSGIHVDFNAQLKLDSTVIRGSQQEGLLFGSTTARLLPSSGNQYLGNGVTGIHLTAFQLPGLARQDSIAGNGTDLVVVDGGQPDPGVAAFTIFAQPQRAGSNGYRVQNGLLDIGTGAGQSVTLDSNLVLRFGPKSGVVIGDSAGGTRRGTIVSLGTNRSNAPRLTSASLAPAPGNWYGLEIGRLASNTRLANVRIEFAGDTILSRSKYGFGLLVRSPAGQTLSLDSVVVVQSGLAGNDTNTAGIGVLGSGNGVDIRRTVSQSNIGYGFAVAGVPGVKIVGDTSRGNIVGFGLFTDSLGTSALTPSDSVAGNVAVGNALYPLQIEAGRLPTLFPNAFVGNGRDTMLLTGGFLFQNATLIKVPGVPWRVGQLVQIDSDAVLTLAPRDTIAFDSVAGFVVGDSAPAALRAVSTGGPILLTPASGNTHWFGLQFRQLSQPDTLMNVVIEKAGFVGGGCQIECLAQFFIIFGSVNYTNTTPHPLVLDSVTIRQAFGYAVQAAPSGSGAVHIKHSQFYDNPFRNAINTTSGLALSIDSSDIYHYRSDFGSAVIVNKSVDSVIAHDNWWGDSAGPGVATVSNPQPDSIGRALLDEVSHLVAYQPFAAAPHFPVSAPIAAIVGTPDSMLDSIQAGSQLADSVRVRVVDAFGRGISGQTVTWSTAAGNGTLAPTSGPTDPGGRRGAHWALGTLAKTDTATATSGAASTHLFVAVLPGPTSTVSWELLPPFTQGQVSADSNTVTFTSTGRRGVIITHAFDANGNPTRPSLLQFEDVPTPNGSQPYGVVDSSKGDTIFFHATVTVPATFQLHAIYNQGLPSQLEDAVFINMNAQAKGLRINQDTAQFNSLCPSGPGNFACSRFFLAELLDSAGTPLPPNGGFVIQWAKVGAGSAVTLDSVRGVMGDSAFVTARANGSDAILAHEVQGPFALVPAADTLAIDVQQVPFQILINPASTPAGLGDTVTFSASVSDVGGAAVVPSPAIHWRADAPFTGYVTFIDTTSVAGVAKVRLDSVYQSFFQTPVDVVTAFAVRGPGDTLVHFAQLVNPIQVDVSGQGANPFATAVNPKTGRVYVVNQFTNPGLVQVFDSTPANIATIQLVDMGPHGIAVNPVTTRIYTANQISETVSIIDGSTNSQISSFIPLGPNSGAIAVDTVTGRVYASGLYCVDFPATCSTPFLKIISGTALVDSIQLPDTGRGVAIQYNAGGERIFVSMDNDTVVVIDPVTKTIVDTIAFPSGSFLMGVAANSITKRVYVAEYISSQIGVIDGTPGVDTLFTNTNISVNNPNFVSVNEKRNLVYSAASSNNFVLELDGATNNIRHEYIIGSFSDFPQDAAINAADQRVYVPHPSALTLLKFFTH